MKYLRSASLAGLFSGFTLLLSACGGGETGPDISPTPQFSTTNYDMYLPTGIETKSLPLEMDGMYVFDGITSTRQKPSQKIASRGSDGQTLTTSARDVAGIVIQATAFANETSAEEMLTSLHNMIQPLLSSSAFSKRQIDLQKKDAINAQLEVTLATQQHATDFLNAMISALFTDITEQQLSDALIEEPFILNYTINIGIVFNTKNDIVLSLTVMPSELGKTYASIVNQITDTGNILSKGTTLKRITDEFSGQAGGGNADFLFVVDNSGSMGSEQQALSDAANAFIAAMDSSGLDYQAGVITTDNSTLRGTGFTADATQFKIDVIPGTSGSGLESGIYFSEIALQSMAEGDTTDGSVTLAGYPRNDSRLSVIYLSDEPNSYRVGNFNPASNLFLSRGYTVYAIINENSRLRGQYDDLADNTNGFTADIDNTTLFPEIMNNIAQAAGGASSWYALTKPPLSSTIEVKVDGIIIEASTINGWSYSVASNSILFHGDAIPEENTNVVVNYFTPQAQTNTPQQVAGAEALKGSWTSQCEVADTGEYVNGKTTFSGNTFETVKVNYSDSSCANVVNTSFVRSGRFTIGNLVTTSSGLEATEIDITTLKEGEEIVNNALFNIFRIDNGKLTLGKSDAVNDMSSASKRSITLDFDAQFTKE